MYPFGRELGGNIINLLLARIHKRPVATEISKGLLKQCFGILDNLIKVFI